MGTRVTYQPFVPSLSDTIYKRYFHGEFSVFTPSTKPSVFEGVEKAYENPNLIGSVVNEILKKTLKNKILKSVQKCFICNLNINFL